MTTNCTIEKPQSGWEYVCDTCGADIGPGIVVWSVYMCVVSICVRCVTEPVKQHHRVLFKVLLLPVRWSQWFPPSNREPPRGVPSWRELETCGISKKCGSVGARGTL